MLMWVEASQLETSATREFQALRFLFGHGMPVAEPLWLDADGQWLGRPAIVLRRLPGKSELLELLADGNDAAKRGLAQDLARIAAAFHALDVSEGDLGALGKTTRETVALEQVAYWEAMFRKARQEPHPMIEFAFRWLRENAPVAERLTIVHGDYRFGNFLYDDTGVTAILDWEMVHLGDPAEDLAWSYRKFWGPEKFLAWDEYVELHARASGRDAPIENLLYYRLFCEAKHAAILATGSRSFVDGRTLSLSSGFGREDWISGFMDQFFKWLP
jgi:aminoglycoside phosphotransferase (APT) family kinase protein